MYKSSITLNWQGKEVKYIIQGIDQVIVRIDKAINDLNTLNKDIRNTAAAIRREELIKIASTQSKQNKY